MFVPPNNGRPSLASRLLPCPKISGRDHRTPLNSSEPCNHRACGPADLAILSHEAIGYLNSKETSKFWFSPCPRAVRLQSRLSSMREKGLSINYATASVRKGSLRPLALGYHALKGRLYNIFSDAHCHPFGPLFEPPKFCPKIPAPRSKKPGDSAQFFGFL